MNLKLHQKKILTKKKKRTGKENKNENHSNGKPK